MRLPQFVFETVKNHTKTKKTNPHLLLYRYLYGGKSDSHKSSNSDSKTTTELKNNFIYKADTNILKHIRARQNAAIQQMKAYKPVSKTFQLVDRMVVGLGIPSSFENGLLLDWIHGVPFINGDAIKGAARSYASERMQENETQPFMKIFGTLKKEEKNTDQVNAGKVIFFNAYPTTDTNLFDIDILTNHYPAYYTGQNSEAPGDWHSPNPVVFLTIRPDVKFGFTVASESEELATQAMDWLENALIKRGMGAKKRVGYGHFLSSDADLSDNSVSEKKSIVIPALDESEKLIQKIKGLQKAQIPGMAANLVKEIESIGSPEKQKDVANALILQMDKKTRKRAKDKLWMKKLNDFQG
ncbi:MAG: CRISPR-associated RAMP protein, Cmr6 family [Candidatus Magnetoglobus multicellularis str. Araruama]|uniref:CRISPR-associated RAMP protein, Cmr6 family n=1 Tax=Candidatus Magnetoglobus multicellularis str. Araruama TaxID=890399 RepID=A0A1V1P7A1_9BACT|nr:MAG: CRISPR-associated RAMP protein, Cmr6 family [Candidatus Magnetoglobus multicellularis str. Araruama]